MIWVAIDAVYSSSTEYVGRILESYATDLSAGMGGMWVEDADDVGDVVIGETRILLSYPSWIEDVLGRYREEEPPGRS